MIPYLVIVGYLIGAAVTARAVVYYHAKMFTFLSWKPDDTFDTLFSAAMWPIIFWMVAWDIYRLHHPAKSKPGIFARWHESDRSRKHARPSNV